LARLALIRPNLLTTPYAVDALIAPNVIGLTNIKG
jgi:hypothetical protein